MEIHMDEIGLVKSADLLSPSEPDAGSLAPVNHTILIQKMTKWDLAPNTPDGSLRSGTDFSTGISALKFRMAPSAIL